MSRPIKVGITHGDFNGVGYEVILNLPMKIYSIFAPPWCLAFMPWQRNAAGSSVWKI